jgi:HK97 family phage portal protein
MKFFDNLAIRRIKSLVTKTYSDAGSLTVYDRAFSNFIKNYWEGGNSKEYVGAVRDAIEVHSFYFTKAKFRIYKNSAQKTNELTDHVFNSFFERPNSKNTWWEYAYKIPAHWGLWGIAYIHIKRNILSKEPFAYQLIPPPLIEKERNLDGSLKNYLYVDGQNKRPIPIEDLIVIKYPNPYSDEEGFAIISSVADQTAVNYLQMQYMKKFFENGGFMGLIFSTTQEMRPANFQKVLAMLEEKFMGSENAYKKVGLFDSGLQPVKAAYSIKDMDLTESRKLTKEDIFQAWKVADIMVGRGNMDRAGNEAAIYQFTSGIIDPLLNYVDSCLTLFLKKEWKDDSLKIIHDSLAPKDQESSLKYYESGLKNGWLTINEVRKEENWNDYPYPLADVPIINPGGGLIRIDLEKQIGVENAQGKTNTQDQSNNPSTAPKGKSENENSEIWEDVYKSVGDEQWLTMRWKQFNTRLEREVRRFERILGGYFTDQQRRILEAVLNNFVVSEAFNLQDENLILSQLLEIDLWDIMKQGYKYGDNLYGAGIFDKDILQKEYKKISDNTLLINNTTFDYIRDIKNESELQKAYKEIQSSRKTLIAVTTVAGTYNAGLLQAMKDAGLTQKIWLSMRDRKVRANPKGENHKLMDGVSIPLDEPFEVPSRHGKDLMMYPADPSGSIENIAGDRCTILGRN